MRGIVSDCAYRVIVSAYLTPLPGEQRHPFGGGQAGIVPVLRHSEPHARGRDRRNP